MANEIQGEVALDPRICEVREGLNAVDSHLITDEMGYTITQTVRALLDSVSGVESRIGGAVSFDPPSWAERKTGVNSLIRTSSSFQPVPVNSPLELLNHIESRVMVFGTILPGGEVAGTVPGPEALDPGVAIPKGRGSETITKISIFLDGEDVTSKVLACKMVFSRDKFCGEVDISWKDDSLFRQVDCLPVSTAPRLRVVVSLDQHTYDDSGNVVVVGDPAPFFADFFLEKRDISYSFGSRSLGSWGRSRSALLTAPFAKKYVENPSIIRDQSNNVLAKDIALELLEAAGIPEDKFSWEVYSYEIRVGKFSPVGMYPIEALQRLAEATGGIVITDRQGDCSAGAKYIRVVYKYPM